MHDARREGAYDYVAAVDAALSERLRRILGTLVKLVDPGQRRQHGFLRRHGSYKTFNAFGASTTGVGLNDKDHVVGNYVDPGLDKIEGFLTNTVNFAKVMDPSGTTTFPSGINNSDVIVGTFFDSFGNEMGFMASH